ncbi:response regulator transcription factor [Sediminibacterium ginsengisoli]|uniref:DNA-binding response regulator, NarL/FixJ family, contains REC and HTH domains n=1 Tax=Sediminibacterium ginsengisoli TaxID=413434 RepID=A0A1T4MA20_9BACT|nr:response regulator transcription factor [Sediminibacterium ginsengisoli]SJZ63843.1 DNA-binding response regulator, NarL/FixJ family, contains REC and HTH domains [Sediminibacterium ginsengisoli]
MEKPKIRVLIADDHIIFRTGLKSLLLSMPQIELLGEASDGSELVSLAQQLFPDVILVDIIMPVMDGIHATRELCRSIPGCRIIALSVSGQESMIMDMLEAGALGYLLKNADNQEIENAISAVYQHRPYFCKEITGKITEVIAKYQSGDTSFLITFTDREKEIIHMICEEYTSKEIARLLFLSKRTIEGHRTRIMNKMGVKSIAGIITYALEKGLYKVDS